MYAPSLTEEGGEEPLGEDSSLVVASEEGPYRWVVLMTAPQGMCLWVPLSAALSLLSASRHLLVSISRVRQKVVGSIDHQRPGTASCRDISEPCVMR